MKKKVALIIPCAPWVKYNGKVENVRTWRFIINLLKENGLEDKVDLYAIDCIKLKSTGKPIGIWNPIKDRKIMKEIIRYSLDSYPSWEKFKRNKELMESLYSVVKEQLKKIGKRYQKIYCYINVKGYFKVLNSLSKDFDGKIKLIRLDHFSPFAFFKRKNVKKLLKLLNGETYD